jgi:PAS domain-containing protein
MGYSCAAVAAYSEEAMIEVLHETSTAESRKTSNTWDYNGQRYFFERGRERDDGAITGTVYRNLPDGVHCRKSGSVRIEPDGKITRWSGSNQDQRQRAEREGGARFQRIHSGIFV